MKSILSLEFGLAKNDQFTFALYKSFSQHEVEMISFIARLEVCDL